MIRTRSLTKDFVVSRTHTVHAVRGITIDIEPGELVAVLGPNGAGKTTTMRMLTTLIAPTAGSATVAGHDVVTESAQVRRLIGYVGQGNGAGHNQRAGDELFSQGVIYGLDRRSARRRAAELMEALDLSALGGRKVSSLSGGQRRRLDVAMGLVHSPTVLFLDEPSTGLDPQNRANLWQHILQMRDSAATPMTIVLTTHYLDEADSMAGRVVVVDHGEVIADDTAGALKAKLAGDRVVVAVDASSASRTSELARLLGRSPGAREVEVHGSQLSARVADGPRALPELVRAADHDGIVIATAAVHRPTLDDVFLTLTGRRGRRGPVQRVVRTPTSRRIPSANMGTQTSMTSTRLDTLTSAADRLLDILVVPGYSSVGPRLRRGWWPADPQPFSRPVDVLITGGSSGIGAATAAGLAGLGARVHLVGRKANRLEASAAQIRLGLPDAELVVHEADVSDLDSVRALTETLTAELDSLHALVHCAGVMPAERTTTAQAHELAFATHILGPFLLTVGLRPLLQADGDGRVVFVSSGGMYTAELESDLEYADGEYKGVRAYARTKRMQVVLAERLGTAFGEPNDPVVHSMHPGWASTPGITESLPGFNKVVKPILRTAEQGADTIVWLAAAREVASSTGRFWHDRRVRPTHYLPWQQDDPAARNELWRACVADTGVVLV